MLSIAYDPIYAHPLPEGHRFPMLKYELIPQQLMYEGIVNKTQFFCPEPLKRGDILRVHTEQYLTDLETLTLNEKAIRKIGFPLSEQLVLREKIICQGSIDCAVNALKHGASMNIAGGTHHAYTDRGEGFCLLNDFAIAAQYLLNNSLAGKILICDLDVHQGNGTAKIFEHEERVFTFSMHGKENYPLHKEKSDLDLELATYTSDEVYLGLLKEHLPALFDDFKPDIVFYLSGVDILETDKLGKLKVSKWACGERDRFVAEQCYRRGIPIAAAMGGGYSARISDIVDAHCQTFKHIQEIFFH